MDRLHNPRPGEILKREFLDEMRISENELADAIGVPAPRIAAIVDGRAPITGDVDRRLCRFFRLSEGYFLRLESAHEALQARRGATAR